MSTLDQQNIFRTILSILKALLPLLLVAVAVRGELETTLSSVPLEGNITASSERDASAAPIAEYIRLPQALDADRVLEEHSRHFLCIPMLRIFNLELRQPLAAGEHIALIGSHSRLGEWQLERSIEMRSLDGGKRLEWLAKVAICANERIAYRYFIYTLDAQQRKRIRIWEGQQHPRLMESYQIYRQPGIDYFGETASTAIDVGGRETAWLRYDRLIELKFIWQRQLKIHAPSSTRAVRNVRLKLEVLGEKFHDSLIEVSRYAYNRSQFRQQPPHGVMYNCENDSEDIVVFRIMEPLRVRRSYRLRIFSNADRSIEIAHAAILNVDLRKSEGVLRLPLHSATNGFDIGQLIIPYLIVRPLKHAELLDMRGSFHHFWPLNWPTMHVANRGVGKSFYDSEATYIENTIKSFQYVSALNGDMIELDVQLTLDYIPIVWHEDGFYTAPQWRRVQSILDLDYTLIRDMTYRELKRMRVFVLKSPSRGIVEYSHLNVRSRNVLERIFPRLAEIYRRLPKSVGLIVDIKWPQFLWDDNVIRSGQIVNTLVTTLDKNRYVNRLIAITARYGCGRPLIFASFDADICTMLRYKQNVYPVIFLTTGRTKLWQPYKDLRTQSYMHAVNFAQSEFLLGTAPHVANFLERPRTITLGLDLTQVVFLWGEELQSERVRRKFEKLHATGLIYDRIDRSHRPHRQWHAFFGAKELQELFGRQCASTLRNASSTSGNRKRRKYITIRFEQ